MVTENKLNKLSKKFCAHSAAAGAAATAGLAGDAQAAPVIYDTEASPRGVRAGRRDETGSPAGYKNQDITCITPFTCAVSCGPWGQSPPTGVGSGAAGSAAVARTLEIAGSAA